MNWDWTTARDIVAVFSGVGTFVLAIVLLYLKSQFVPRESWDVYAKATAELMNEEAKKRRDLQDRVVRLEERVSHLPSSEEVAAILVEVGRANAHLSQLDTRLSELQETMRREVDSVKELVGSVQETMRMVRGNGRES